MREMTSPETREFVAHNLCGVLCLASDGRAYGLPLYYGYDGRSIFFMFRPGLKNDYIDSTGEACFTIMRVMGLDQWASVQAFGRLEPVGEGDRRAAQEALMRVPLPPEWGESEVGEPRRSAERAVLYRLSLQRLVGRYSEAAEGEVSIATVGM